MKKKYTKTIVPALLAVCLGLPTFAHASPGEVARIPMATDYVASEWVAPIISDDGSMVAYVSASASSYNSNINFAKVAKVNGKLSLAPSKQIVESKNGIYHRLSLSGNGKILAYIEYGSLHVIPVGNPTWTDLFTETYSDDSNTYVTGASVSNDGTGVAYSVTAGSYDETTQDYTESTSVYYRDLVKGKKVAVIANSPLRYVVEGLSNGDNNILLASGYESDTAGGDLYSIKVGASTPTLLSPSQNGLGPVSAGWDKTGKTVIYASSLPGLVPNDINRSLDVFASTMTPLKIRRLSVNSRGEQGNFSSSYPYIAPSGQYVVFSSKADNLRSNDSNYSMDLFVSNLTTGDLYSPIRGLKNTEPNGDSKRASISAGGQFVVFWSEASNLVSGDTNKVPDFFVAEVAGFGKVSAPVVCSSPTPKVS